MGKSIEVSGVIAKHAAKSEWQENIEQQLVKASEAIVSLGAQVDNLQAQLARLQTEVNSFYR